MVQSVEILIVGAGIAGCAAAVALGRDGHAVRLLERRADFGELGAGLQISPNAWRCLQSWGLDAALREVVSMPEAIVTRDMASGRELGRLPLTNRARQRYGAPYATVLRTDLHSLLLAHAKAQSDLQIGTGMQATAIAQDAAGVDTLITGADDAQYTVRTDAALLAEGVQSTLSAQAMNIAAHDRTGLTAYRGVVKQAALPQRLRSNTVTAWLGRQMHAVVYPLRGGEWLNVVLIVADGLLPPAVNAADLADIRAVLARSQQRHSALEDVLAAIDAHGQPLRDARWTRWPLRLRPAVRDAQELASGRVAALGDAAHPMVPFLAQGAAMAIEDAEQLRQSLASQGSDVVAAFAHYARLRARRVARVQRQAWRNGRIFHLWGPLAAARNLALTVAAPIAMDSPWLYAGGPVPMHGTVAANPPQ
ncbi:hypothetical protein AAV94_01480 [Lampropedia cohaerens]|uniref:FAD-binding domain-containing protein n=1 Tax=Lampropedia cohaerens TaxID=1610491 RepID=A0A0U1Q2V0_9BURK|nr:FAD-dependent monooxygenase [Lampropedia cohaerens]KKW69093.1 hypothetical protein AAV94_01480 [Lampropedia cohaerens]